MKKLLQIVGALVITSCMLCSCNVYKRNIMLQLEEGYSSVENNKSSWNTEPNYTIQPNDRVIIDVFTNSGERIIDPDFELSRDINTNQANFKPKLEYLINDKGEARLPMVGFISLIGLTKINAELKLQAAYSKYYDSPYVNVTFVNKRVTVLGDVNAVVVLENENTHLLEVLARANAINNNVNVQNIRLVRNEEVYLTDLSTKEGLKSMNMIVQPGDIIYVEPVRRPFIESIRDYGPLISIVSSITAIIAILATN